LRDFVSGAYQLEGSADRPRRQGGLTVAAPSAVFTIARQHEPEDGCLWIYDTNDRETLGFTMRGIESLKELIADQKR
jgi:hypothetical protein